MKRLMILCCTVLMVIGIFVVITVQNKRTYYSSFPKEKALFHNVKAKDEAQRSNIETFFQEWEEWSREITKKGTDSLYNSIFEASFLEYGEKTSCKYLVLPQKVRVHEYDCKIYKAIKEYDRPGISSITDTIKPTSIKEFTPIVNTGQIVLYSNEGARELVETFLLELTHTSETVHGIKRWQWKDDCSEEDEKNMSERWDLMESYIPVIRSHWGTNVYCMSAPQIYNVIIGKDGYCIAPQNADHNGSVIFVPKQGKPVVITTWIQ